MLARSLFNVLWCSILSIGLCGLGTALTFWIQGSSMALGLLRSWVFDFNGIAVGALGYGLMFFVRSGGQTILAQLNALLDLPADLQATMVKRQHQASSWKWASLISLPTTFLGGALLWNCGYPLEGFARLYLAACSISIYFVATNTLAFFLFTLAMFRTLEERSDLGDSIQFSHTDRAARIRMENIDFFFIVASTLGIIAIYVGFRGTLTANFEGTPELFRDLLILPIALYLPATLCYSFYPRFVLRKIYERDKLIRIDETLTAADELEAGDVQSSLELRKLILEVKEKMVQEYSSPAILSLKDAPSLTLSLIIFVQFVWQSDEIVKGFLSRYLS